MIFDDNSSMRRVFDIVFILFLTIPVWAANVDVKKLGCGELAYKMVRLNYQLQSFDRQIMALESEINQLDREWDRLDHSGLVDQQHQLVREMDRKREEISKIKKKKDQFFRQIPLWESLNSLEDLILYNSK